MKKYQIIQIKWLDSLHSGGWQNESGVETSKDRLVHYSVGYFLKEDSRSIIIIQSYQNIENKNIDAVMEIPKVAILKIKKYESKIL